MNLSSIYQQVTSFLRRHPKYSIRQSASALGLSKSAVDRHHQRMKRRLSDQTTAFFENEAGHLWLRRLVLGVLFYFGIQRGLGAESLSFFYKNWGLISMSASRRNLCNA